MVSVIHQHGLAIGRHTSPLSWNPSPNPPLYYGFGCTGAYLLHAGSLIMVVAHGIFSCGMWDLVPWPGIEPRPPVLGVRRLSHRTTREVSLWALSRWPWDTVWCVWIWTGVPRPGTNPSSGFLDLILSLPASKSRTSGFPTGVPELLLLDKQFCICVSNCLLFMAKSAGFPIWAGTYGFLLQ